MNKYIEYFMATAVRMFIKKPAKCCPIEKKKGVLIICRHPLGDTVTESPFLRGIRGGFPEHHITIVCSKENYNLLEQCPYIDELLIYSSETKKSFLKENLKKTYQFAKEYLWKRSYDLAVIPSTSMPAIIEAWIVYFSGAKRRITYSEKFHLGMHAEYMGIYDRYFTDALYDCEIKHEVERNIGLLQYLHITEENDNLELWTDEVDYKVAHQLWENENIDDNALKIIVNLSTSSKTKDWPVERYVDVCRHLKQNYHIEYILIGAGNTAENYAQSFKEKIDNVHDFVGRTTIRQTIEIMRCADIYFGGDTGPMHFAAACKLSGIAIYKVAKNIDNPAENFAVRLYPWHAAIKVIQPERAIGGCEHGCHFEKAHCIKRVPVKEVLEELDKIIKDR